MKKNMLFKHYNFADILMMIIMSIIMLGFIVPFIHILGVSLSDANYSKPGLVLWPNKFTLSAYFSAFQLGNIVSALKISVLRVLIGVVTILTVNLMAAYVTIKEDLPGVKILRKFFLFTMYVSGGMIPTYLVIQRLGLTNSFWVYIFPLLITPFYMVLLRTYMQSIPDSMEEAARIDGAGYFTIFWRIMLPLCKPIIASVSLFAMINHWNSMTDTAIYNNMSKDLYTLQYVLYQMLQGSSSSMDKADAMGFGNISPLSLRMALTVITMLPVLVIYPFVQKHFISGIMVGAVKA